MGKQCLALGGRESPRVPGCDALKAEGPHAYPDETSDRVAQPAERAADLPLASLAKHEMEDGRVLVAIVPSTTHARGSCHTVRESYPLLEAACRVVRDLASHRDPVLPFVAQRGMEESVAELSVVGEEHEPLGIEIEPPDRKEPLA